MSALIFWNITDDDHRLTILENFAHRRLLILEEYADGIDLLLVSIQ